MFICVLMFMYGWAWFASAQLPWCVFKGQRKTFGLCPFLFIFSDTGHLYCVDLFIPSLLSASFLRGSCLTAHLATPPSLIWTLGIQIGVLMPVLHAWVIEAFPNSHNLALTSPVIMYYVISDSGIHTFESVPLFIYHDKISMSNQMSFIS